MVTTTLSKRYGLRAQPMLYYFHTTVADDSCPARSFDAGRTNAIEDRVHRAFTAALATRHLDVIAMDGVVTITVCQ